VSTQAESIFKLMRSFDVLEALPRSGYLIRGIRVPENVAAHSFATALLAMLLAEAEQGVDELKTLKMALIHETGEILTTDIPRIAQAHLDHAALEAAEISIASEVFQDWATGDEYVALCREYAQCQTREARLVRAADKLQMLCKVRFYEKAGARNLDEFFQKDQGMKLDDFPVAQALFKLLKEMMPE